MIQYRHRIQNGVRKEESKRYLWRFDWPRDESEQPLGKSGHGDPLNNPGGIPDSSVPESGKEKRE